MRDYEFTVVFRSDMDEQVRDELVNRVIEMIPLPEGSEDPKVNRWGRRQLAYPINKQTEGYYVFVETAMVPEDIAEMERNLTYLEEVLRYLVVRKDA